MRRRLAVTAAATAVFVGLGAGQAMARPVPSHLRWTSPPSVSDGVPAAFASIKPCPLKRADGSPLQGTLQVFIFVSVSGGGGGSGQGPFAVNPDGSWVANATFNFGGFHDAGASVQATCQDVTVTGTIVGSYTPHAIVINP
jgi:hypothetical protein